MLGRVVPKETNPAGPFRRAPPRSSHYSLSRTPGRTFPSPALLVESVSVSLVTEVSGTTSFAEFSDLLSPRTLNEVPTTLPLPLSLIGKRQFF